MIGPLGDGGSFIKRFLGFDSQFFKIHFFSFLLTGELVY
jgi:hypothetical protein